MNAHNSYLCLRRSHLSYVAQETALDDNPTHS